MTREEIKAVVATLGEGDEVEVGMTWFRKQERRAAGVLYRHSGSLCLFGYAVRWDYGAPGKYITYIRLVKKAPMPEPKILGTVIVTEDGQHWILADTSIDPLRWYDVTSSPSPRWNRWELLLEKNPRALTNAEVEAIPCGKQVAR